MADRSNPSVEDFVQAKLAIIQRRHNFAPNLRASAVPDDAACKKAYHEFALLRDLIRKVGLDVEIPYDPLEDAPEEHPQELVEPPKKVYFSREGLTSTWKIGNSYDPRQRAKDLQTGNPVEIQLVFEVVSTPSEEQAIHRYLSRFRSKKRGGKEWFDLPYGIVKQIYRQMRAGESFKGESPLQKSPDRSDEMKTETAMENWT